MNWREQQFSYSSQQVYDPDNYFRQIVATQHLTLQKVLHCVNKCPSLKDDPQFLSQVFYNRKNVIEDLIDWMFYPQKVIDRNYNKHHKHDPHPQKNKMYRHIPFLCKKWILQNDTFYHKIVQAAVNNTIPIQRWFSFLQEQLLKQQQRQNKSFWNSSTFVTSMGYFNQTMIPFINFIDLETVNSAILCKFLAYNKVFSKKQINASQTLFQSASYVRSNNQVELQLVKSTSLREQIVLFGIFKQPLLDKLIQKSFIQGIFKFTYFLCLRCLQDNQKDPSSVKSILTKLFCHFEYLSQKKQQKQQLQAWTQNLLTLLKDLENNIETDSSKVTLFLQLIDQSFLPKRMIEYILNSDYYNNLQENNKDIRKYTSTIQKEQNNNQTQPNQKTQGKSNTYRRILSINKQNIYDDQTIVQLLLQCLTYYIKLSIQLICPKINKSIEQIFQKIASLFFIIKQDKIKKYLPFSSGQNIAKITMVKHSCIKLLLETLNLLCKYYEISNQKPIVLLNRQQILQIVQRYINQNKWNNIVHLTLEKLFEVLNSPFCNIQKSQDVNNQFLTFLISSFINNQYVFLETLHFTNQGNLHLLYKMAKLKARYLNSNQKLLSSLKNFQPWKKFLTNDLNKYQQKFTKNIIPVSKQLIQTMNNKSAYPSIVIDEVDTIKKLLQQVQEQISWQERLEKRKISVMLKSYTPSTTFPTQRKLLKKLSNVQLPVSALQISGNTQILEKSDNSQDSMNNIPDSQIKVFSSSVDSGFCKEGIFGDISPPILAYSSKKISVLDSLIQQQCNSQKDDKQFDDKKQDQTEIISKDQNQNRVKSEQKHEIHSQFLKGIEIIKKPQQ